MQVPGVTGGGEGWAYLCRDVASLRGLATSQGAVGCSTEETISRVEKVDEVGSLPTFSYPWFPSESHVGSDTLGWPAGLLSAVALSVLPQLPRADTFPSRIVGLAGAPGLFWRQQCGCELRLRQAHRKFWVSRGTLEVTSPLPPWAPPQQWAS